MIPNKFKNGKYNLISVDLTKFISEFFCWRNYQLFQNHKWIKTRPDINAKQVIVVESSHAGQEVDWFRNLLMNQNQGLGSRSETLIHHYQMIHVPQLWWCFAWTRRIMIRTCDIYYVTSQAFLARNIYPRYTHTHIYIGIYIYMFCKFDNVGRNLFANCWEVLSKLSRT